jgi:hypothetical protein
VKKGFSELSQYFTAHPDAKRGALVDTTVLFSVGYPLDLFNEEAEAAFSVLIDQQVPIFSNLNVRLEYLELHRRVLIPECLIDFLKDREDVLDSVVSQRLKSLRTRYRTAHDNGSSFKLSDKEIKELRTLLSGYRSGDKDAWELFCRDYLQGKIEVVWGQIVEQLGLNFIGLRTHEESSALVEPFSWSAATRLMGQFGIGSVDAMILELFLSSQFQILLTSDRDMAYCVERLARSERVVFVPDQLI